MSSFQQALLFRVVFAAGTGASFGYLLSEDRQHVKRNMAIGAIAGIALVLLAHYANKEPNQQQAAQAAS